MRSAVVFACLALLAGPASFVHGQANKAKPAKARFSDEAVELFKATSQGYELSGKPTPAAMDTAAILRVTKAKDAQLQEAARMACRLVLVHSLLQQKKADPEIARIARDDGKDLVLMLLETTFKEKVKPEELRGLKYGIEGMKAAAKGDLDKIEELVFTRPQEQANWTAMLRIFGQGQSLELKEKVRALAGEATNPVAVAKEPIKARLEAGKDKVAALVFTNQAKVALNHCLVFTRAVNDPAKVDRYIEGQAKVGAIAALLLPKVDKKFEGEIPALTKALLGARDKSIDAGVLGLLLQWKMLYLERGGVLYIPTIPAGATVRIPLLTVRDAELLKSSEVSLYCDELTLPAVSAGTLPVVLLGGAGTPLKLDKKGVAAIRFALAANDPVDPEAIGLKMAKVFALPMTAGKTYTIRVMTQQFGTDLRVEDAAGKTQAKSTERATFMNKTIGLEFTPAADGTYRIVCSETYSGPQPFLLTIQRK
jgi:hypothetical protein